MSILVTDEQCSFQTDTENLGQIPCSSKPTLLTFHLIIWNKMSMINDGEVATFPHKSFNL